MNRISFIICILMLTSDISAQSWPTGLPKHKHKTSDIIGYSASTGTPVAHTHTLANITDLGNLTITKSQISDLSTLNITRSQISDLSDQPITDHYGLSMYVTTSNFNSLFAGTDSIVDLHTHAYNTLTGRPDLSVYTTTGHTHSMSDITDLNVTNHTHTLASITDLNTLTIMKSQISDFAHTHTLSAISDLANLSITKSQVSDWPTTFAPSAHTIASHSDTVATGPNLNTLVSGNGTTLHTHSYTNLTDKPDLTQYAETGHNHTGTYIAISGNVTQANMNTLTGGSNTTLHAHGTQYIAIAGNVTQANLNTLTGSGSTTLHKHSYTNLDNIPTTFTPSSHTIASHSDTVATGANLNALVSGNDTTLHSHAAQSHTLVSHSDITGTVITTARLNNLLNGSSADTKHTHDWSRNTGWPASVTTTTLGTIFNGGNSADSLHTHSYENLTGTPPAATMTAHAWSLHNNDGTLTYNNLKTITGGTDIGTSLHSHAGTYAPIIHNHDTAYAPLGTAWTTLIGEGDASTYHNHSSLYVPLGTNWTDLTDTGNTTLHTHNIYALASAASTDHNHDATYVKSNDTNWGTLTGGSTYDAQYIHTHGNLSPLTHNHTALTGPVTISTSVVTPLVQSSSGALSLRGASGNYGVNLLNGGGTTVASVDTSANFYATKYLGSASNTSANTIFQLRPATGYFQFNNSSGTPKVTIDQDGKLSATTVTAKAAGYIASHAVTPSEYVHFRFNEVAADNGIYDETEHFNKTKTGRTNDITTVAGAAANTGTAMNFNGVSAATKTNTDWITFTDVRMVKGEDWSMAFWIKPYDENTYGGYPLYWGNVRVRVYSYAPDTGTYNSMYLQVIKKDNTITYYRVNTVLGIWKHITLTKTGSTMRMYVNGALAYTSTDPLYDFWNTQAYFNIGGLNATHNQCADWDDFRYYKYSLTQAQIDKIYNAGDGWEGSLDYLTRDSFTVDSLPGMTDVTSDKLQELTDGSTTSLHSHSGLSTTWDNITGKPTDGYLPLSHTESKHTGWSVNTTAANINKLVEPSRDITNDNLHTHAAAYADKIHDHGTIYADKIHSHAWEDLRTANSINATVADLNLLVSDTSADSLHTHAQYAIYADRATDHNHDATYIKPTTTAYADLVASDNLSTSYHKHDDRYATVGHGHDTYVPFTNGSWVGLTGGTDISAGTYEGGKHTHNSAYIEDTLTVTQSNLTALTNNSGNDISYLHKHAFSNLIGAPTMSDYSQTSHNHTWESIRTNNSINATAANLNTLVQNTVTTNLHKHSYNDLADPPNLAGTYVALNNTNWTKLTGGINTDADDLHTHNTLAKSIAPTGSIGLRGQYKSEYMWLKLDASSLTTVDDTASNNTYAVQGNTGSNRSRTGKDGNAFNPYTSASDLGYIKLVNAWQDLARTGEDYTILLWVTTPTVSGTIFDTYKGVSIYYTYSGGTATISMNYSTSTGAADGAFTVRSSSFTADSNWHQVAVIKQGSNFYLIVDGTASAASTPTSVAYNSGVDPIIGTAWTTGPVIDSTAYFRGGIDDFRLYKYAVAQNILTSLRATFGPVAMVQTHGNTAIIEGDKTGYLLDIKNGGNNADREGIKVQAGEVSGAGKTSHIIDAYDSAGTEIGGLAIVNGVVSTRQASDRKLKQDITDLPTSASTIVRGISAKKYKWKRDPTYTMTGFIAQDVQKYMPEAVTTTTLQNGEVQLELIQDRMIPYLWQALQEQTLRNDRLEERIRKLEQKH